MYTYNYMSRYYILYTYKSNYLCDIIFFEYLQIEATGS